MSEGRKLEAQCWICPKCHDDHRIDGPCAPENNEPFNPSADDKSYIAYQFRELRKELEAEKAKTQRGDVWKSLVMAYDERDQLKSALAASQALAAGYKKHLEVIIIHGQHLNCDGRYDNNWAVYCLDIAKAGLELTPEAQG